MSLILGLSATFLTTVSFLPQTLKLIKTRDTKSISLVMYCIYNVGIVLWIIYGLQVSDTPIIISCSVTFIFSMTILLMKIFYK